MKILLILVILSVDNTSPIVVSDIYSKDKSPARTRLKLEDTRTKNQLRLVPREDTTNRFQNKEALTKDDIGETIQKYIEVKDIVMTRYDSHGDNKHMPVSNKQPYYGVKREDITHPTDMNYRNNHGPTSIKEQRLNNNKNQYYVIEINEPHLTYSVGENQKSKNKESNKHTDAVYKNKNENKEYGNAKLQANYAADETGNHERTDRNSHKTDKEGRDYFFIKEYSSGYNEEWDNKKSKDNHNFYDDAFKDGYFKKGMSDNIYSGVFDSGYGARRNLNSDYDGGIDYGYRHKYDDSLEEYNDEKFKGTAGDEVQYDELQKFYNKNGIARRNYYNYGISNDNN